MEFYFLYLLQVRSILCGMCFLIMNVIFNIFEAISQLTCFLMTVNISYVLLYPTLHLCSTYMESSVNCYISSSFIL
jgi:hypothetical protein